MVLNAANFASIDCLRGLSETDLKAVNHILINDTYAGGGGGNFGPGIGFGLAPDGKDSSDAPTQLLRDGKVNRGLKRLIVDTTANEGLYTSSDDNMPAAFPALVRRMLPGAGDDTILSLQEQYHPRVPPQLVWDWTTNVVFACQAHNLANALPDRTHLFINPIPPAAHGDDISCKTNNADCCLDTTDAPYHRLLLVNQNSTPVDYPELALAYQDKIVNFVHGKDIDWPLYGDNKSMYNITGELLNATLSKDLQDRCSFINAMVLDEKNQA